MPAYCLQPPSPPLLRCAPQCAVAVAIPVVDAESAPYPDPGPYCPPGGLPPAHSLPPSTAAADPGAGPGVSISVTYPYPSYTTSTAGVTTGFGSGAGPVMPFVPPGGLPPAHALPGGAVTVAVAATGPAPYQPPGGVPAAASNFGAFYGNNPSVVYEYI